MADPDTDLDGKDAPKGKGASKKKVPDPGKTTNADTQGVTTNVPGKRTNTDEMGNGGVQNANAQNTPGKTTQVDAKEGKTDAKDAGSGSGGGGGGGNSKNANHGDPNAKDTKVVGDKDKATGKKDAKKADAGADTKGKKDGKGGDNTVVDGKAAKNGNTLYTSTSLMPADRVDVSAVPAVQKLTLDVPRSNKNLDDKWRSETGRTPAEHHQAIVAELGKFDAEVQRATAELQSAVDQHVTKITSDITAKVEGFKSTLVGPGRQRIEAAYGGMNKAFDDGEKQALEQVKKSKAAGVAQIATAHKTNKAALEQKFTGAKGLIDGIVQKNVPIGAAAIKQFAGGIPAWVKEAKDLAKKGGEEAGNAYKPESFMNAKDHATGVKALAEEVKKQHAINHGKKLGAQYEGTLMGWSRNADKKAEEVIKNALGASSIEFDAALDISKTQSTKALGDAQTDATKQLDGSELAAQTAVGNAKKNGIARFDTEKKDALAAADTAGTDFTQNTSAAGTELTDRIKKKASEDAKSYAAISADLQKQLKKGVPQKLEQIQPKIESAKAQLTKLHAENTAGLEKLSTEGTAQLGQTVTKLQTTYNQAITDREQGAGKAQKEILGEIAKGAADMGGSIANIGKVFSDTTTKETAKIDFAIQNFQKGADDATKDFGTKVKQKLEQERTALYENLKASVVPDKIKAESEPDAMAEIAAKQKSIDKDVGALRDAMDGWGTGEGKIFAILRKLGHGEITYLEAGYNHHYPWRAAGGKTPLRADFYDEMSGTDYKTALAYIDHNRELAIKLELADSTGFWNDDEARIEDILRNASDKEIEYLNTNDDAKKVVKDVKESLGGADLDVMTTLLDTQVSKEDRATKADAIRLFGAMDGMGTDEAKMKTILEGAKTPEERMRLRAAFNQYATSKGWSGGDGGAKGESDDALTRAIAGDTSGGEGALMQTLAKTEQTDSEVKAAKLYDAADGGGTNEDQIFDALDDAGYAAAWKAATPEERKKLEAARAAKLDKDLSKVSDGEHKTVQGLIDSEMDKAALTWEEFTSGTKKDGKPVSAQERATVKSRDPGINRLEWMVAQRKLQTGQAEPELMLAYAVWGVTGTDEETINKVISTGGEPKSIEEVEAIRTKFASTWGVQLTDRHELKPIRWGDPEQTKSGPAPGGVLNNELSGKDWNRTRQLMCGKPETAEQLKYVSLLRKDYATSGLIGGGLMAVGEAVGFTEAKSTAENQQARFDAHYAANFKNNPTAKLNATPEGAELERLGEYLATDYEAYSAALSSLVDGIVTALEIVGSIVITVLTAGAAAPALMAVLYNLALSATTIIFKAAALGDSYGAAELGADIVKAAGSAAFAGIGELKALNKLADKAGAATAKGMNSLGQLTQNAATKAGVKIAPGALELGPQAVDKVAKIVSAGTKNLMISSGQEVYNTLTDEKTYSMKLEDVVWGDNSLGKRLLMNAPRAFVEGSVTQWINGMSGTSNRDNTGRLKKPLPNALANMIADMGGTTAGFFAYLDNYNDAEMFWKQLLQQNATKAVSGFLNGYAMHKMRAVKSGRDFINGGEQGLSVEGLKELFHSLDPHEVKTLAQFVEKYGGNKVFELPDEFKQHTSAAGKKSAAETAGTGNTSTTEVPTTNHLGTGTGQKTTSANDNNVVPPAKKNDDQDEHKTLNGKKPSENDPDPKTKGLDDDNANGTTKKPAANDEEATTKPKVIADDETSKKPATHDDESKKTANPKTHADNENQTEKPDKETAEQAKSRRSAGLKPSLPDANPELWAQPHDRKGVPEGIPLSRQELRDAITKRYGKTLEKYLANVDGQLESNEAYKPLIEKMKAVPPGKMSKDQAKEFLAEWTRISGEIEQRTGKSEKDLRVLYNVVEQDDFPAWYEHVKGLPKEQQAKLGHMWREEWKLYVRDMMSDENSKEVLYLRDRGLSGDRRGTRFDDFVEKGTAKLGSVDAALDKIIASSMTSNPEVNKSLTGDAHGQNQVADDIRKNRIDPDAKPTKKTPAGDEHLPEHDNETKKPAGKKTVEDEKLEKIDDIQKRLKSTDEAVRQKAQHELDALGADPEYAEALKLKGIYETAKGNQKKSGDTELLSDNIGSLINEADKNRVGKNPELQAKRDKFERAVALAILKEGPVRKAIDKELQRLCEKAFDYLAKTRSSEELSGAIGGLGTDAKKGYGGGVGKDTDVMMDVLANGNIRERMLALQNFMQMLGNDALSVEGRKKIEKLAGGTEKGSGQYTSEDAKKLVQRVLQYEQDQTDQTKRDTKGLFNPNSKENGETGVHHDFAEAKKQDMDTKLPPLVAEKVAEFLGKQVHADGDGLTGKGEESPLARTTITVKEAIAKGLQLSEREIEAAGGLDAPLNWVVGQRANLVNPKAQFIADAKEASMPLKAGVSGTTFRWMQIVDLLGGDPNLARLCAMASLQAADAHSFHEIAFAAKGFGVTYDPNQPYANVGLPPALLKEIADSVGVTLDELNGKPTDDKPGK